MGRILKYVLIFILSLLLTVALFFIKKDIPVDELKTKYASEPSKFVGIMNMDVHYRAEGISEDSLPVVLLHGTGASLHTFDYWANVLKDSKKVFRLDLPGFGLTGPFPDRNYTISHYVEFLNEFLKKNDIQKCILAGNSLGGNIAWNYALKHPEIIQKLVLIDAAGLKYTESKPPLAFRIARMPVLNQLLTIITPKSLARKSVEDVYSVKSKVSDSLVDRYYELTLCKGNRQAMVDRFKVNQDYSNIQKLKGLACPVLILWGSDDLLIPVSSAIEFSQLLPNDTLVVIKDCGHVPMEECPEESLNAFINFIKK